MKKHLFCATLLATTILAGNALAYNCYDDGDLADCVRVQINEEYDDYFPAYGECGPNCTFTYDGETLHISGPETGEGSLDTGIFRFEGEGGSLGSALMELSNQKIVIDGNITSIGGLVFGEGEGLLTGVTSITLPDNLQSIGSEAFSGLVNVTSLTLPESVTSIGDSVLAGMNNLTTLTIPEKLSENLDLALLIDDGSYARYLEERSDYQAFYDEVKANTGDRLSDDEINAVVCENTDYCIEDIKDRIDAAAEALRNKVASLTINCIGDANVCKQNILNALPQEYKDFFSDKDPFIFAGASSGSDDASALAKKYHGTPLLSGKKIYTIEEAMEATKNGTKFHVGLTYK